MKRIGVLVATVTGFLLITALPALAGSGSAHGPRPGGGPNVSGASGVGGTAFTGANVSTGIMWLIALAVVGALALYVSRRRLSATR